MNYSDSIYRQNYQNYQQDYRQQDYRYQHQQDDYQTINIFRDNYVDDNYSIYSSEEQYSEDLNHYESELRYTNSIYSDINEKNNNEKNEQVKEKEEKVISDIISFYTNDEPVISELIPLPISPENLEKLKNQWNKEDKFSMKINEKEKKEKTVWKRISDSFKKQSSPKRSLYDILTK
jgi:hypothetical protein